MLQLLIPGGGGMTYDFYIQRDSFLHRLDPRVKLVLTICLIVAAFLMETLVLLLVLLGLLHVLLLKACKYSPL